MRIAAGLLLLIAPAFAQTVWQVGAGANLDQVFANAAAGDIVLLAPGSYLPFTLQKGLAVIGPATIQGLTGTVGPWEAVIQIPAGQQAHLIGLQFPPTQQPSMPVPLSGQQVMVSGAVGFEDCSFGPGVPNSLVVTSGEVVLQRCTVQGGRGLGGGMLVSGGTCTLSGCSVTGLDGSGLGYFVIPPTPGLEITAGTLLAAGSTLRGGNATDYYYGVWRHPEPGVRCGGTARVSLADCTVTGGSGQAFSSTGAGAVGIDCTAPSPALVEWARGALSGGTGTPPGGAVAGNVQNVPTLVGLDLDHGLVRGAVSTITATAGNSQQLLGILATFANGVTAVPGVVDPVFGAVALSFPLVLAVPAPGAIVTATVAVPNAAGLLGVALWSQALQFDGAGSLRASAVVGGAVH
ncbi:MAG: hypothetical protein KDC98_11920 [Planctomycetes bacterium]|nr:hypothetical protein [Planctomycetota bacterium]